MAKGTRKGRGSPSWTFTHQAKEQKHWITFTSPEHPYFVKVTVDLSGASPTVREIAVAAGLSIAAVSVRDLRRLPLASYTQAAIAVAMGAGDQAFQILRTPRGRPSRGRSTEFYRELSTTYRQLLGQGVTNPAKDISRRKHVDANTVHQWLFRARKLGFLEPSPRSRQGRKE